MPDMDYLLFHRSRQEIENDYDRDWERTALLPDEILNRPMTVVTLLSCLPSWVRFCLFPGPIRFLFFRLSLQIGSILRVMHRQLVLQGAKLDAALARKASPPLTGSVTRVVLLRYHHKLSTIENIKFRLALLFGKTYIPPAKTSGARQTSRAKERLDPKEYDDLMLP